MGGPWGGERRRSNFVPTLFEVADDTGKIRGRTRWQVAWMERALLGQEGWLLIDDIHCAAPALLRRLKLLRDRVNIIGAGVPPFKREELRRMLWGLG